MNGTGIAFNQAQNKTSKQRNYEKVVEALQIAEEEKIKALEEKREKIKVQVVKFYQKKYPNEDTSWLESLTEKQYDEIFDKLLNYENLDEIKHRIDEMKKSFQFLYENIRK